MAASCLSGQGSGSHGLFQAFDRQALAGLDISGIFFADAGAALQAQQSLNLPNDFATRSLGLEHLPDKAFEGQAQGEDALAAVFTFVLGRKQSRGQEVAQMILELGQCGLAEGSVGAPAESGEPGAQRWEKRRVHSAYIYAPIDRNEKAIFNWGA